MRRHQIFSSLLALALLGGCSPLLTGAACLTDCNCPSAQRCARNPDGGDGRCHDGANYCGKDAGPALFGTLTVNGGIQKPSGNAGTVVAWDHNPTALPDGGFESPLYTVPVNSDGTWEIDQGAEGTTYYLTGLYNLNAGRVTYSLPAPFTANGFSIDVDVPTYTCQVWSVLAMPGSMPYLAGLIADVPDITDGSELSTATVKASDGASRTFELKLIPHPEDPFSSGQWAWGPLSPGDTPAVSGTYTFSISGTGYGSPTRCEVNSTLLTNVPTAPVVPNPWVTIASQTVTFYPPRETQETFFTVTNSTGGPEPLSPPKVTHPTDGSQVSVTFGGGQLGNVCPVGGTQCLFYLFSLRTSFTGNTGINQATATSNSPFSTSPN